MVKFIEVDPDEIPNFKEGHRGRVSYPLLKSFLETGLTVAMLDRTGMQQSLQSLNSSLNAYIRNHSLPIKLFTRRGEIYLMRLDLDGEGKPLLDVNEALEGKFNEADHNREEREASAEPITPDAVEKRWQSAQDPTR